jgi:hypothetical protein
MADIGFHCFAKIRALFHRGVEFRTVECSKCFISFGGFFLNSNIFFGEKTQTNDSDVGGLSPDPVLILNLDPGLNTDPSAIPDKVTNLDPIANPDPVEYRSGCWIRVRINSATNPDQFSYSMAVINLDLVKNPVMNLDQVTTPDPVSKPNPVTKLDPRTNPVTDPGLAPNLFTNTDSEQEPDREAEPDSELDPDSEQDPDCKQCMDSIESGFLPLSLRTANDWWRPYPGLSQFY